MTFVKANIHTPQRLHGEPFGRYKERRAQSRAAYLISQRGTPVQPFVPHTNVDGTVTRPSMSLYFNGQHMSSNERHAKRELVERLGIRQVKRMTQKMRELAKAMGVKA